MLDVALAFLQAGDQDGVRLLFAFWVVEGRLNIVEQNELNRKLKERDMPEIIDWWRQEGIEIGRTAGVEEGIEKGIRATKLEDARKMLARGYDWNAITDITDIRPEDLI